MSVARPYWLGDQKRMAWGLLALLVGLMVLETQLAVMLIDKTGELTSALAAKQVDRFWSAVRASLMVVAVAVPVYAFYYYMRDAFSNHWRRWLTHRFLDGYLSERKYYDIGNARDIDNPDQRISEDINTFTGRSTHFLLIFLGLADAAGRVQRGAVHSSRTRWWRFWRCTHCWAPLARCTCSGRRSSGSISGRSGARPTFRFGLMRLRENAESIAFYRGEPQERAQLNQRFEAVFSNFAKLIKKQRSLNLYQRGFSQLTLVLPAIILANDVLSGELEVGRAIQAAGAFAAVLAAVSLIVDNFESLSRFVAGIDRLHALSQVVLKTPAAPTPWAEPPTQRGRSPGTPTMAPRSSPARATPWPWRADAAHAAVWPSAGAGPFSHPGRRRRPAHHRPQRLRQKLAAARDGRGCGAQARAPCSTRPLQTCSSCRSAPICSPIPCAARSSIPARPPS